MAEKNIIVKYALILAMYTAIAGGVLALTYSVTEPRRLANAKQNQLKAQQEVLPQAVKFEEKTTNNLTYARALDEEDRIVGYVVLAKGKGYSSILEIMLGLDKDCSVIGMKVLSQTETPGLGTRITEDSFIQQFMNKKIENICLKKDGGEIDAITGATISSRAATNTVASAVRELKKIVQKESQ